MQCQLFQAVESYDLVPLAFFTFPEHGSFAVAGPVTWNSLPAALRARSLTVTSVAKRLNNYLFNSYDCSLQRICCAFLICPVQMSVLLLLLAN